MFKVANSDMVTRKMMMAVSQGDMEMAQRPEAMILAKKITNELSSTGFNVKSAGYPWNIKYSSNFHSKDDLAFVANMHNLLGSQAITNFNQATQNKQVQKNQNEFESKKDQSTSTDNLEKADKSTFTGEIKTIGNRYVAPSKSQSPEASKPPVGASKSNSPEVNYKDIPSTSKVTDSDLIAMAKQQSTFDNSTIPDAVGNSGRSGLGFSGGEVENAAIDVAKVGTDLIEPTKAIGDAVSMAIPLGLGATNSAVLGKENQEQGIGNAQQAKADSANFSSEQSGAMAGMMVGGMFGPIGQVAGTVAGAMLAPKTQPIISSTGGNNETNSNITNFGN